MSDNKWHKLRAFIDLLIEDDHAGREVTRGSSPAGRVATIALYKSQARQRLLAAISREMDCLEQIQAAAGRDLEGQQQMFEDLDDSADDLQLDDRPANAYLCPACGATSYYREPTRPWETCPACNGSGVPVL